MKRRLDGGGGLSHAPVHLVCVDFEATCDVDGQMPRESMEIIEFPWASLDCRTGEVTHRRQLYCRPEGSDVTPFCTQLTGITPERVADAPTLGAALREFEAFTAGLEPAVRAAGKGRGVGRGAGVGRLPSHL
jgi:inhibitor of KinA sporulation pathway (predicted exonuclease)